MLKAKSLKFKLLLSFGTLSIAVLAMTAISLLSMTKINSQYGHIVNVTMPNVQLVGEINATIFEANRLTMRVYQGMSENNLDTFNRNSAEFPERAKDLEKLNKEYRTTKFVPGEEVLYNNLWVSWKNYESKANEYLKVASLGLTDADAKIKAGYILDQEMKKLRDSIEENTLALINFQKSDSKNRSAEAVGNYEKSFTTMVIFSIVIIIASITIGFIFSNYINQTLSQIADKIKEASEQTSTASHDMTTASSQLS